LAENLLRQLVMTLRRGLALLFATLFFAPIAILVLPIVPVLLPILLGLPALVIGATAGEPRGQTVRRAAQLPSIQVTYSRGQARGTISA
jgi:hypothetical protein